MNQPPENLLRAPTRTRWSWAPPIAIVLLTVLAYWPSLSNGFIWDDDYHVTNNLALRSVHGLWLIWFELGAVPQYYPLTHSTFWIEYHLWGSSPLGYHVDNLMLQMVNALLLGLLLRKLAAPGVWWAAAIFAVHPTEVETVAWVSERKNLLSGFFYLLAMLMYLRTGAAAGVAGRGQRRWAYGASLVLFGCALLSKTVTSTLPAALLVIIWWKRGRVYWRDVWPLLPMFVAGAIMGSITGAMERYRVGARGPEWNFTLSERMVIAGRDVLFYGGKLLWPANQQFIYPRWTINTHSVLQWLAPATVLLIVLLLWSARRRIGRGPLAAVLLFVGTLGPALGFVNIFPMRYSFVADHFQYLAGIALIALFAAMVSRTWIWIQFALLTPIVLILVLRTNSYVRTFRDAPTQWQDVLSKDPGNWMANNNVGDLLLQQGRLNEAEPHFVVAIQRYAYAAEAWVSLGNIAEQRKQYQKAIVCYGTAVRLRPGSTAARYDLANMLMVFDQFEAAVEQYRLLLAVDPNSAEAQANMGIALARLGRTAEAEHELQTALRIDPSQTAAAATLQQLHGVRK